MKKPFLKKNGDRKLNVMFGDFCYYNRYTLLQRYTPLGIGLIAQYATQQFGNDIKVSLFKSVDKFIDQAKQNPPDVVGLSVYYWNIAINQYLIKCLREMFGKNVVIILGIKYFFAISNLSFSLYPLTLIVVIRSLRIGSILEMSLYENINSALLRSIFTPEKYRS